MGRPRNQPHTVIPFRPLSPDGKRLEVDCADPRQIQLFNGIVDIGIKRTKPIVLQANNLTLCQMLAAAYMQGLADGGLLMGDCVIIGAMP